MKPKKVVFGVVNDIHAGSSVALCTPRVALDDGQHYERSKAQTWLTDGCWTDYWRQVAERRKEENALLGIGINGDAFEGDHHNTSQLVSRNLNAQGTILSELLKVPLGLAPDFIYIVRGTPAHTGEVGSAEEGAAKTLLKDGHPIVCDPDTGTASQWHPVFDVYNTRIDMAHQGRAGQREHTRQNAMNLYAHDILLNHIKSGDQPPDLCLRAHFHRWGDSYDACSVRVVTNAAWQLKTGYAHKNMADSLADIGGLIITIRPGDKPDGYDLRKIKYKASRGTVCRAA